MIAGYVHAIYILFQSHRLEWTPGLEVIKLEYSLGLKIKRNDWLPADTCSPRVRKQPIIALYFETENERSFITSRPGDHLTRARDYGTYRNSEQWRLRWVCADSSGLSLHKVCVNMKKLTKIQNSIPALTD